MYGSVLITGAPGCGKTTLLSRMSEKYTPLETVDFGKLLLDLKKAQGHETLTYEQMRTDSSVIITSDDVQQLDEILIRDMPSMLLKNNVLIDSHAVTSETYGARITSYSADQLQRLGLSAVIMVWCEPRALFDRIQANPDGRAISTLGKVSYIQELQGSLAGTYGVLSGCRTFVVDNTDLPDELPDTVVRLMRGVGLDIVEGESA